MSSWLAELQGFAPHSGRPQASQFWPLPMTCSAKAWCVLSPSPVETPLASQFLPRSSTASGTTSSLRRCGELAASRRLRIAMSARHSGFLRKQLRRAQVLAFFSRLPPCLVGLEACATAHYWARELRALGHEVRLMPAQYVKAYIKRNK